MWSWGKPVTHLMQYHLLQWEVAKVKPSINSNMTLTVLNLHQKTPKSATTKIQVKDMRYIREIKKVSHIPTKYQLPTPYVFRYMTRTRHYRSRSLIDKAKGQIKVTTRPIRTP